jgi:hypothetical protein
MAAHLRTLLATAPRPFIRAELVSTPMCFFVYVASIAVSHADLIGAVCPAMEMMSRVWPISKMFYQA